MFWPTWWHFAAPPPRDLVGPSWFLVGASALWVFGAAAAGPAVSEHARAVSLARAGDLAAALAILDQLARTYPDDYDVARDRIAVTARLGRREEAIGLFEQLPEPAWRDFVLEAAARAYRDLKHFPQALALYRRGNARDPRNPTFAAGAVLVQVDLGQAEAALGEAQAALHRLGESIELLLAAAYAAETDRQPIEALRYAERAVALEPRNRDALRAQAFAVNVIGAPDVALRLARSVPGLLSDAELRRLEAGAAAALVRWGQLEPPNEAERFAATDRAITELDRLIERWVRLGDAAADDVLRVRFDRLVALHDRVRMAEVVREYEALRAAGIEIPGYVLNAAADAYLYRREPERADELYRRVLASEPKNVDARIGLYHALVETERFDEAIRQIDATAAAVSPWIYLKGLKDPIPNPVKVGVDIAAANARLYADALPEAQQRLDALAGLAPFNTDPRVALAGVYEARGWPRRAREELEIARGQKPKDLTVEGEQARVALTLHDWHQVDAALPDLAQRFPESLAVQKLGRQWRTLNNPELQFSAERAYRSSTSIVGGGGMAVGAQMYSPPIGYDWRIFAGYRYANEQLPEGRIIEDLYNAGVEYRSGNLRASAEARYADYDRQKAGAKLAAAWTPDDYWSISGSAERFSLDTPLRALKNGVTADSAAATIGFRSSESRSLRFGAEAISFSDGNLRTALAGHAEERLVTAPRYHLNGVMDVGTSQNSKVGVPYFNPSTDALAAIGLGGGQVLYRRYDFAYEHRLVIEAGPYWEEHFGAGLAWSARYEHRVRQAEWLEATFGVGFSRQPYDGNYESAVILTLNGVWRF